MNDLVGQCENILCSRTGGRIILLKQLSVRVCTRCYSHFRSTGTHRIPKRCETCNFDMMPYSKGVVCQECWVKLECSFEGCTNNRVKHQTKGLCGGHMAQINRGAQLHELWVSQQKRDGLTNCPIHDYPHYQTPKGHNRCSKCSRDKAWMRTYNLTPEQVFDMFDVQGGTCALDSCTNVVDLEEIGSYHIDHCHSTGKVRGILCPGHNHMLGFSQDQESILIDAVNYLRRFNK